MRAYGGAARSHNAVLIQFVAVQPYWKQAEKMVCVGTYAPTHTIFSDSFRFLVAQAHSLSSYFNSLIKILYPMPGMEEDKERRDDPVKPCPAQQADP